LRPVGVRSTPRHPRGGLLRRSDTKTTGLLAALAAYLVWGISPVYFKALRPVPPLEILAHRVVWSLFLLAALVAAGRGWRELRDALASWKGVATFAATTALISANWLIYIWAVNSGHVLEASLGYFVNPLVNVVLGVAFLRESLSRRQAAAVALAAAGVLFLLASYGRFPWISLALAATFGLYGLARKKAGIGPVTGLLVETALLAPLALAYLGSRASAGSGAFGTGWRPSLLLLAAGPVTAIPLVWFTVGVQRLRLSTMGVLQYLAPSLQFALAVWLYAEPFTRAHAVTFAFIWVSLALYTADALALRRPAPAVVPLD
jgi:chloramphenicol-sensitive protein RarD